MNKQQPKGEPKIHYKMYKQGKHWLFAAIFAATLGVGCGELTPTEAATETVTVTQNHGQDKHKARTPESESPATDEETAGGENEPSAAAQCNRDQQKGQYKPAKDNANNKKKQPATDPQTLAVPAADTQAKQAEPDTGAQSPASTAGDAALDPQQATRAAADETSDGRVTVDKDNFTDYFNVSGDAHYNEREGIVTLTPDRKHQSGNVTLKNKISSDQSFELVGQINLGDKSQPEGADGISFGFHVGQTQDVGHDGGGLGFAGLADAFGWKADTFWDPDGTGSDKGYFDHDPDQFHSRRNGTAFGAFVHTEEVNGKYKIFTHEDDHPKAAAPKPIAEPEDNDFNDISIVYDAESKNLTVRYDRQTWTENISQYVANKDLAFFVAGATGESRNLQQFRIYRFTYTATGVVQVHFVDDTNNEQEMFASQELTGPVHSVNPDVGQMIADATDFLTSDGKYLQNGITLGKGTQYDQNSGALTFTTIPGDIYVHFTAGELVETKQVTKTIHYVDEAGQPLFADYTDTANFEVHTNKVTQEQTANPKEASLGYQDVPQKAGYSIVDSPLAATTAQTVTSSAKDIVVTVVYHKDAVTTTINRTIHYVDVSGKTLAPDYSNTTTIVREFDLKNDAIKDKITTDRMRQENPNFAGYHIIQDAPGYEDSFHFGAAGGEYTVIYAFLPPEVTQHQATQTIHYVDTDGNILHPKNADTVTFTRTFAASTHTATYTQNKHGYAHPENPYIKGYHIVSAPTADQLVAHRSDKDSDLSVVYAKNDPIKISNYTATKTVHYIDEHGLQLTHDFTDSVTFTKFMDPVTGGISYSQTSTEFGHQDNPIIFAYHVISSPAAATANQTAKFGVADQEYTVVYAKDAPTVIEQYTAAKTVQYVSVNNTRLAKDFVSAITFTKLEDPITGAITYTQTSPYFGNQGNPLIFGYHVISSPEPATSNQKAEYGASGFNCKVVYAKNAPTVISQYTATKTVHYADTADKKTLLADDFISEVTFTKLEDPLTGAISYQQTAPVFGHQDLPDIKGYWMCSGVVTEATEDQPAHYGSTDQEYWVYYAKEQDVFINEYTATKTVHYQDEQGTELAKDFVVSVTFDRFQDPVTDEFHDKQTAPVFGHQDNPYVKGYHVISSPAGATSDQKAQYGSTNQEYTVVYLKDDPIVTHRDIHHTYHYWSISHNQPIHEDITHTITVIRKTDPATGEHSDTVIQPVAPWNEHLHIPNHHIARNSGDDHSNIKFDDPDQEYDILYAPLPAKVTHREIKQTVRYVDENGNELATAHTDTVTFLRTLKDSDNVIVHSRDKQAYSHPAHPSIAGYHIVQDNLPKAEQQATHFDDKDSVYTVVYAKNPADTGETPPPVTGTPDTPEQPDKPTTPEEPVPDDDPPKTPPTEPETDTPEAPNKADLDTTTPAKSPQQLANTYAPATTPAGATKMLAPKQSQIRSRNRILPQTGFEEEDGIILAGVALLLGIMGIASMYRRQH